MAQETVLVTGVTGFVGTHVALAFWEAGFRVRGTVRSPAKAEEWIRNFSKYSDRFEYHVVKDIGEPGAFDQAVVGSQVVAHTASPYHFSFEKPEDMLNPAIQGTLNMCRATKHEPAIRHVVITSSFAAMNDLKGMPNVGKRFDSDSWNPASYEEALGAKDLPPFVYSASKKFAEKAFWDYVEKEKPGWTGTAINPPMIFGPPLQVVKSLDSLNTSTAQIWNLINGTAKTNGIPPTRLPTCTDVRDVALAHVRAVQRPAAQNQRYLFSGHHYSNDQFVAIIAKTFPGLKSSLPETDGRGPPEHFTFDSSKAEKDLGIEFRPLEETVVDAAKRLLVLKDELA